MAAKGYRPAYFATNRICIILFLFPKPSGHVFLNALCLHFSMLTFVTNFSAEDAAKWDLWKGSLTSNVNSNGPWPGGWKGHEREPHNGIMA